MFTHLRLMFTLAGLDILIKDGYRKHEYCPNVVSNNNNNNNNNNNVSLMQ